MINVYTDLKYIPQGTEIENYNDSYFIFNTINEDFTEPDISVMKKIDNVSKVDGAYMTTPFGSDTFHKLSTGCKTLLNIFHHPEILFNAVECGSNALTVLYTTDDIAFYMPASRTIYDISSKGVCFNNKDIVYNLSEYGFWWENEYKRRSDEDDI